MRAPRPGLSLGGVSLSGHLGDKAAAMVDGQLSREEEERAWGHVLGCPGCRRLVEHEGWTKRQLGALSGLGADAQPPAGLLGSLYAVDAASATAPTVAPWGDPADPSGRPGDPEADRLAASAWSQAEAVEAHARRRRSAALVVGGGAVAASVLGLVTLAGSPILGSDLPSRPSPATIQGEVLGTVTAAETKTPGSWGRRAR